MDVQLNRKTDPNLDRSVGARYDAGNLLIGAVLIVFAVLTFLPFYYVVLASVSDPDLVQEGELLLIPRGFQLDAYQELIVNPRFIRAFVVTVARTVLGVIVNLGLQLMLAYGLSRRYLPGRSFFMVFIVITMMFNGGIIPTYLIVRGTGLINTIWALVIPSAISTWNVILLRNFFENVPDSLEESARIDGANDIVIFLRIFIPLSLPAIVTIGLFVAVFHWNTFIDAVIYINSERLKVLQIFLRDVVMSLELASELGDLEVLSRVSSLSVRTASIFLASLPILIVYPFIQRHFIHGVMIGAVKG